MAMNFAQAGYTVFTINYRFAPKHPFPAVVEDAAAAYYVGWWKTLRDMMVTSSNWSSPVSLAGGNLTCALTVAATFERNEYFAKNVWDTQVVPRAAMPFCGILEVENWQRYIGHPKAPIIFQDRPEIVSNEYTRGIEYRGDTLRELANPLKIIESQKADRTLPPFFAPVGGGDFLVEDCKRLQNALSREGVIATFPFTRENHTPFMPLYGEPMHESVGRIPSAF